MKVAIIGATRGLGRALLTVAQPEATEVLAVGRKIHLIDLSPSIIPIATDLSQPKQVGALAHKLNHFAPEKIFYCAGGGPYGLFGSKKFKDHRWAWNVSFVSAARLLFEFAKQSKKPQFILIGSKICEAQGDHGGASYAASKHALLGIYRSLRLEEPTWDVRLYSPGYIDTGLLPSKSSPREKGLPLLDPLTVANDLWTWSKDSHKLGAWRKIEATRQGLEALDI